MGTMDPAASDTLPPIFLRTSAVVVIELAIEYGFQGGLRQANRMVYKAIWWLPALCLIGVAAVGWPTHPTPTQLTGSLVTIALALLSYTFWFPRQDRNVRERSVRLNTTTHNCPAHLGGGRDSTYST